MNNVRITRVKDRISGAIDYKTQRPVTKVPGIIREYMEGGVRMYECDGARKFIADTYDKNFSFKKGKVRPNNFREDLNKKR